MGAERTVIRRHAAPRSSVTKTPEKVPLSATLRAALDSDGDGHVTVGEIMDRVAERGFGLLLFVVAIPTLIPVLPPGASGVVGMLYIALGFQLVAGLRYPWLPRRVRGHRLSPKVVGAIRRRGVHLMERIEKVSRPRWLFLENAVALRLLALLIIANGLILFLPLPFMNTLPALGIMAIGVGLLNRDGAFLLLGGAVGVGTISIVATSAHLLIKLQAWIRGLF